MDRGRVSSQDPVMGEGIVAVVSAVLVVSVLSYLATVRLRARREDDEHIEIHPGWLQSRPAEDVVIDVRERSSVDEVDTIDLRAPTDAAPTTATSEARSARHAVPSRRRIEEYRPFGSPYSPPRNY